MQGASVQISITLRPARKKNTGNKAEMQGLNPAADEKTSAAGETGYFGTFSPDHARRHDGRAGRCRRPIL